jgi:hypothetical protein
MPSANPERAVRGGSTPQRGKQSMRLLLFVLGGALAGYLYYRLVGCRSGTCPITSSPIISSLYGAMMGFLLSRS